MVLEAMIRVSSLESESIRDGRDIRISPQLQTESYS